MRIADVLRKIWKILYSDPEKLEKYLEAHPELSQKEFDFEDIQITEEEFAADPRKIIYKADQRFLQKVFLLIGYPNSPEANQLIQPLENLLDISPAKIKPPLKTIEKKLPIKKEGAKFSLNLKLLEDSGSSEEVNCKVSLHEILKTICTTCIGPKNPDKAEKLINYIEESNFRNKEFEIEIDQLKISPQELITTDSSFLGVIIAHLRFMNHDLLADELIEYFSEDFIKKFNCDLYNFDIETVRRLGGYGYLRKEINGFQFIQLKQTEIGQEKKEEKMRESERAAQHERGWKIHLSIQDDDRDNLHKALPIILKLAFKYQLPHFKVKYFAVEGKSPMPDGYCLPQEKGKQLTIYCGKDPSPETVKNLRRFCQELTYEFKKNLIKPSEYGENVRYVNKYIGYKNDSMGNNKYRHPDERGYKLREQPDPFKEEFKKLVTADFPPFQYKTPHHFCLLGPNTPVNPHNEKAQGTIYLKINGDNFIAYFLNKKGMPKEKTLSSITVKDDLNIIELYSDKAVVDLKHRDLAQKLSTECGFHMLIKEEPKPKKIRETKYPNPIITSSHKIKPFASPIIPNQPKPIEEKSHYLQEKKKDPLDTSFITSPRRSKPIIHPYPSKEKSSQIPKQSKSTRSKSTKDTRSQRFEYGDPRKNVEKQDISSRILPTKSTKQKVLPGKVTSSAPYEKLLKPTSPEKKEPTSTSSEVESSESTPKKEIKKT